MRLLAHTPPVPVPAPTPSPVATHRKRSRSRVPSILATSPVHPSASSRTFLAQTLARHCNLGRLVLSCQLEPPRTHSLACLLRPGYGSCNPCVPPRTGFRVPRSLTGIPLPRTHSQGIFDETPRSLTSILYLAPTTKAS
jgi:hypothetical protein